jgi:ABC-type antimicrobial peptide transport system permease subunit
MAHLPTANAWVVARARGDAGSVASAVRRVVQGIDPEIGIVGLSTMGTVLRDSLWRQRFAAFLVGLLAALAVLIATGGLYAVIAHAVERRMHELGVRIALGATDGQVAQMVLGHGVRLTAIGTAPGAMLTMAASHVLAREVHQAGDLPSMLVIAASGFLMLTLIACWVPTRRALTVDPVTTLRAE